MPRFEARHPEQVVVGGGRYAKKAREQRDEMLQQFIDAIEENDAGIIFLEPGDDLDTVKKNLRRASHITGIGIRSSWDNDKRPTKLAWKRHKSLMTHVA